MLRGHDPAWNVHVARARWPEGRDVGWRAVEGFGQPGLGYPE